MSKLLLSIHSSIVRAAIPVMAHPSRAIALGLVAVAMIGLLSIAGCSSPARPTPNATMVASSTVGPTATITPFPTAIPTGTPVPLPTDTATPVTPTKVPTNTPAGRTTTTAAGRATATRTPTPTGTMKVKIFMVALNDDGKSGKRVGCGDSLVAVERTVASTTAPLTSALKELVSTNSQYYGDSGLYNALYQSNLKVTGVSLAEGKATINLSGIYKLGGTCDSPRFGGQITETALQFPTVKQAAVFINGIALETILSSR